MVNRELDSLQSLFENSIHCVFSEISPIALYSIAQTYYSQQCVSDEEKKERSLERQKEGKPEGIFPITQSLFVRLLNRYEKRLDLPLATRLPQSR